MKIFVLFLCLVTSCIASAAETNPANLSDLHIRSRIHRTSPAVPISQRPAGLVSGTFSQSIDHFGALPGQTFAQRYWYDCEYATADDAPILFHMGGEEDVDQSYYLNDNTLQWAKALGARVVYIEHRYYGKSLPFSDLSADHLQYMTLNNVIEDLASFQIWISAQQGWRGKWISVGGSYSGTLSAIYRQKHPELVVGALAASAPMISGVGEYVDSGDDMSDLSSEDPSSDTGSRQWAYEACTSVGYWEADGPAPGATLENPSASLCRRLFGNIKLVDPTAYNQSYDLPFLSNSSTAPSNILFSYGSEDIWTTIGLSQQTNANPKITISVIEGAGHHFDLNPPGPMDSDAVMQARAKFLELARRWLSS